MWKSVASNALTLFVVILIALAALGLGLTWLLKRRDATPSG